MKNAIIIVTIISVVVIIAAGSYYGFTRNSQPPVNPNLISQTPQASESSPISDVDIDKLMQEGSSYADPGGSYVVLYPNDFKLDTQGDGQYMRLMKQGVTQQGQTELYDGVLLVFDVIKLDGKTLSEAVDATIKTQTADGTVKLIQPKKSITINNYNGFSYQTQGLGEATYYVIQKDAGSDVAINIATLVTDPNNVGYQKEVDSIFKTLQILK